MGKEKNWTSKLLFQKICELIPELREPLDYESELFQKLDKPLRIYRKQDGYTLFFGIPKDIFTKETDDFYKGVEQPKTQIQLKKFEREKKIVNILKPILSKYFGYPEVGDCFFVLRPNFEGLAYKFKINYKNQEAQVLKKGELSEFSGFYETFLENRCKHPTNNKEFMKFLEDNFKGVDIQKCETLSGWLRKR